MSHQVSQLASGFSLAAWVCGGCPTGAVGSVAWEGAGCGAGEQGEGTGSFPPPSCLPRSGTHSSARWHGLDRLRGVEKLAGQGLWQVVCVVKKAEKAGAAKGPLQKVG